MQLELDPLMTLHSENRCRRLVNRNLAHVHALLSEMLAFFQRGGGMPWRPAAQFKRMRTAAGSIATNPAFEMAA